MRRYLNLLIGLVFAVRSLVPVGFMLAATPGHPDSLQIVVCTGHGPQSYVLDEKGAPLPVKSPMADKNVCPYAPVGAATADNDAPHLLSHIVRYASVAYAITSEIFRATPKPGAQSARGPPSSLA
jgi:hypothetical protein